MDCIRCGRTEQIEWHHIVQRVHGGGDEGNNLEPRCQPCHKYEHTYCSECNKVVVRRYNFEILNWDLDDNNRCNFCGSQIPIVGKLHPNYKEPRFEFAF